MKSLLLISLDCENARAIENMLGCGSLHSQHMPSFSHQRIGEILLREFPLEEFFCNRRSAFVPCSPGLMGLIDYLAIQVFVYLPDLKTVFNERIKESDPVDNTWIAEEIIRQDKLIRPWVDAEKTFVFSAEDIRNIPISTIKRMYNTYRHDIFEKENLKCFINKLPRPSKAVQENLAQSALLDNYLKTLE